jgi:hypothetical protein
MEDKISEIVSDSIKKLKQNLINKIQINQIHIDNSFFDEKYKSTVNITKDLKIFDNLLKIKKPVLYWFEFESSKEKTLSICNKYEYYRNNIKLDYSNIDYRNTSSYKSKYQNTIKTLYVGKVESGFWGRIVTHLGYNKTPKTAGMQLHYWYDIEKFGDLNLFYIEFDDSMKYLISILEKQLAHHLSPLIGKY